MVLSLAAVVSMVMDWAVLVTDRFGLAAGLRVVVVLLVLLMAVVLTLNALLAGTGSGVAGWTGVRWEGPTVESRT